MIIRPLFTPNDDKWAVMIGCYILNTGSVEMSTRRLIALLDRHSASVVMRFWRDFNLPSAAISFYKGGFIDELNKIVYVRGDFVREVIADKHRAFWRAYFGGTEPAFKTRGKIVKLPNIVGENDSLRFFVNGDDINLTLTEPDESEAA